MKGGKADGLTSDDVVKKMAKQGLSFNDIEWQFRHGLEVEMEHTNDPKIAEQIVRDHLVEFPDYYTALDEMENKLKKKRSCKF